MTDAENDAVIDDSVLVDLREFSGTDDPTMLRRLIAMFLAEAQAHVGEIEAAAADHAPDRVARAAHQLQGSAGFVGASGLMALCAEIEQAAEQGSLEGLGRQVARLHRALDAIGPRLLDLVDAPTHN